MRITLDQKTEAILASVLLCHAIVKQSVHDADPILPHPYMKSGVEMRSNSRINQKEVLYETRKR